MRAKPVQRGLLALLVILQVGRTRRVLPLCATWMSMFPSTSVCLVLQELPVLPTAMHLEIILTVPVSIVLRNRLVLTRRLAAPVRLGTLVRLQLLPRRLTTLDHALLAIARLLFLLAWATQQPVTN